MLSDPTQQKYHQPPSVDERPSLNNNDEVTEEDDDASIITTQQQQQQQTQRFTITTTSTAAKGEEEEVEQQQQNERNSLSDDSVPSSSVSNPTIFEQIIIMSGVSDHSSNSTTTTTDHSSVPHGFLTKIVTTTSEVECDFDVNIVKEKHREHLLALAPILTEILADTVKAHRVSSTPTTPALPVKSGVGNKTTNSQPEFVQYETGGINSAATLRPYVQCLLLESWASTATFVGALILMDRFLKRREQSSVNFRLTFLNVFKLFVAASRVASKVLETRVCNNGVFAHASRITLLSLNLIEERFLNDMDFEVSISKAEWTSYAQRILRHFVTRTHQS